MHKIVLYEFTVSGGLWCAESIGNVESLAREGRAMLTALAADFASVESLRPIVLRDSRLQELSFDGCEVRDVRGPADEKSLIEEIQKEAAGTVLIAPETDGLLYERCRWIESSEGRLIGPSAEVVAITSDKQRTAEHLAAQAIRVPHGVVLRSEDALPRQFKYPAVLKRIDGCGSQNVRFVEIDPQCHNDSFSQQKAASSLRLEEFIPGTAASVAVLCGPNELLPLIPCRQRLSNDGGFHYLGGSLPLDPQLAARAQQLAVRAVATLPSPRGYIGVDLVLGEDPSGAADAVIEINPRLTTSYIGLRAAAKSNLAEAMWAIAEGRVANVSFGEGRIEFDSNGVISSLRK